MTFLLRTIYQQKYQQKYPRKYSQKHTQTKVFNHKSVIKDWRRIKIEGYKNQRFRTFVAAQPIFGSAG
jgi:hypothetical protein